MTNRMITEQSRPRIKFHYCNSTLHSLHFCSSRISLVRRYRSCKALVTYPNLRSVTFSPPVTVWRTHTARICSPHNIRICSRDHPASSSTGTWWSPHRDMAQAQFRPSKTEVKNVCNSASTAPYAFTRQALINRYAPCVLYEGQTYRSSPEYIFFIYLVNKYI